MTPMQSIPVDGPFQIIAVDIIELPLTANGKLCFSLQSDQ